MKRKRKIFSDEIAGFLDRGTAVTGELWFSGSLRIEGEFHGSIATEGSLTIGRYVQVHADIRAGEVEIYGKASGNIEAARRIEIRPTGRVSADLRTPALVIDDGGTLDGRSRTNKLPNAEDETAGRRLAFEGIDEVN